MMKRLPLAAALILFISSALSAQNGVAVSVRNGTTNPATCQSKSLNIFIHRTGAATADSVVFCSAANVWTALLTSSSGVPSTRLVSTTSPLSGGGDLSADRTLTCTLCLTSAANSVTLGNIVQIATNTVLGNATSGAANITALAVGTCSGATNALNWTTNTGFGCNGSIIANTATTATTATNATNGATVSIATNASFFPLFAASSTNSNQPFNLGTGLTFNPSTNNLTTTLLSGTLRAADGTVSAPSISFGNATGVGFFKSGSFNALFTGGTGANDVLFQGGGIALQSGGFFQWSSTTDATAAADLFVGRVGAANLRFGINGAAPVAQTIQFANARGGTDTNTAAVNATIQTPLGTGTGAIGALIVTAGVAAASGTTQHTTTTAATFKSSGVSFLGTNTNDSTATGNVGEYVTGTVAANTTSMSTGTTVNVGTNTNITLSAGDWDCNGVVNFTYGATTSITNLAGGVSTTTGTLPAQDSYFDYETAANIPTATAVATWICPTVRLSLSGSTSVFLVTQATFSASTLKAGGTIRCRRAR